MQPAPLMRHLRWPCLLLVMLAAAPAASACTIPVFRYALERWELSPYELLVFYRSELPAATQSFLDALPGKANIVVTPVDLDGKVNPSLRTLWDRHGNPASLPWVIARRTDAGAKVPPAWTGPCDPNRLRKLVDSPARHKAIAALSLGKTSVFVLLLSGDGPADEAAAQLLQVQLAKLEKRVKLPEQRGDGPRIRLALPLTVGFTILPLKRDEPSEEAFVQLLLGSEDDLGKARGPIVFPIFGRGRLLGSLHGKELDADSLYEVVSFLCGECSCQVKELNPGMDLPIAADWLAIFERIGAAPESGPETPPGATRIAARAKPASGGLAPGNSKPGGLEVNATQDAVSYYPAEMVDIESPAPTPSYRRWLWIATGAAGVLVLLTGAWACMQWRAARRLTTQAVSPPPTGGGVMS
jgi:hypothetical protein